MRIQHIRTGEHLKSEAFRAVRSLTAPEGRIPRAKAQGKALSYALTHARASLRVKAFPPALAQARAERRE